MIATARPSCCITVVDYIGTKYGIYNTVTARNYCNTTILLPKMQKLRFLTVLYICGQSELLIFLVFHFL